MLVLRGVAIASRAFNRSEQMMEPEPLAVWPNEVTVIAVEGIDGSGKSTLIDDLIGHPPLMRAFSKLSRAPEFSSPIGHCLRDSLGVMSPISIAYGFAAERHWLIDHCDETPGGLVIWDRYIDSAYACRSADIQAGRAPSEVMDVVHEIIARMPKPSATLYIDTHVETATTRLMLRQQHLGMPIRNDAQLLEFQREAYERLWHSRTPPPKRLNGETSRSMLLEQAADAILASH